MVSLDHERRLGGNVIGIDEAGRGPLAGPVYAAAVHVDLAAAGTLLAGEWSGINDSKKLSARKREKLAQTIKSTPGCIWAVASASAKEIDEINILQATYLAMRRAALAVGEKLGQGAAEAKILVDGNPAKGLPFPSQNVIKGDAKSLLIAAASILAKTARDEDCLRLDREFPQYGFAKHKGYPTKAHFDALHRFGPCPGHRRSFAPVAETLDTLF